MSKDEKSVTKKPRRIRNQSPEQRRWEGEMLREDFEEADRAARPALRNLLENLEQEEVEDEDESD